MDLAEAKQLMTVSLAHCSRVAKTLADIQAQLGDDPRSKPYSDAVGQILAWFLFEVFSPIGRQFVELRDWPLEGRDWAPGFVGATDLTMALSNVRLIADEGMEIAAQLRCTGLVSESALEQLGGLTKQCRQFKGAMSATD